MLKRVLQVVEETRAVALDVQHELNLLKVQFNDSTGASDDYNYGDTVTYLSQPIDSQEELTEFCNKLSNDRAFRKRVVKIPFLAALRTYKNTNIDRLRGCPEMNVYEFRLQNR
jgi:hypothetical protein